MLDLIPEMSFSFWIEVGIAMALVFIGFLIGAWKKLWNKTSKNSNIDWNIHSQIHEVLTEVRVLAHAARAQIVQFHNGEYFIDGISMQKLSVTHESLANGVSGEALSKRNLLISLFAPVMEKIEKNDPIHYLTDKDKDSYFKSTLELFNVDSYMILPLFYGNIKSGFIMIQWCNKGKTDLVKSEIHKIQDDVLHARNIIQTMLTHQLKEKK